MYSEILFEILLDKLLFVYYSVFRNKQPICKKCNSVNLVLLAVKIITLAFILLMLSHIYAYADNSLTVHKYYTSIYLEEGDTLWNLADVYNTNSNMSKSQYIDEVCQINNISQDNIHSGRHIIVPYYRAEEK